MKRTQVETGYALMGLATILATVLTLAACGKKEDASTLQVSMNLSSDPLNTRIFAKDWFWKDEETGCWYIGAQGSTMTPRMKDGKHWCEPVAPSFN